MVIISIVFDAFILFNFLLNLFELPRFKVIHDVFFTVVPDAVIYSN